MGFGGGSKSSAAAPAPAEPVGQPKADPTPKPLGAQNRTEASPLSRPILSVAEAQPKRNRSLIG